MAIEAHYKGGKPNAGSRPLIFYPIGEGLFTRWETTKPDDLALELSSSLPPDRLEFVELSIPGIAATTSVVPACLEDPMSEHWGERANVDFVSMVEGRLRDGDLTGAIQLFTYSRSGIPGDKVAAAAGEVLGYLTRHPLQRDALLGAFLASLCTGTAAQ
jgi:hypothetical protein